jgi:hypothetical protein
MRVLDINQSAAAEVDAQWNAMPEQHRENSRGAEDQREGNEVPLLAKKVDIRITKKFHALEPFFVHVGRVPSPAVLGEAEQLSYLARGNVELRSTGRARAPVPTWLI